MTDQEYERGRQDEKIQNLENKVDNLIKWLGRLGMALIVALSAIAWEVASR